jgi:hypothetical protein
MLRVQELVAVCPKADTLACRVVEVSFMCSVISAEPRFVRNTEFLNSTYQAYLCVQLGTNASDGGRHSEAADYFTAAVKANAFTSQSAVQFKYQDFTVVRIRCNHGFLLVPNGVLCLALRVGPQVLMGNCKPEKVRCTSSCG